jgi:riboflavin kinase/FMN adenylyltransferase
VIITFHPHPRMVVKSDSGLQLLNSFPEKLFLLEHSGVDHLVVVPFNEEFASQSAKDYVKNFLVARFHPHTIVIGYDHRFGKGREGDYKLLEKLGLEFGYFVKEIPEQVLNEITVSSTKIRKALVEGDIDTANACLGYSYSLTGKVIMGNQLGRTLGFPTANLEPSDPDKLIPGNGVYAVNIGIVKGTEVIKGKKGMMNIGNRPTIDGKNRVIEVNIFNFSGDLYGKDLIISFQKRLRNEEKFSGLEALKLQLEKDKQHALSVLSS